MADPDAESRDNSELLRVTRRKYDRKLALLESIDDKAMQTSRTAILILGFVSSAVVVGGPSAVGDINVVSATTGILGVGAVFAAAFVATGTYTATIIPEEASREIVNRPARTQPQFESQLLTNVRRALEALDREINRNQKYLIISQIALLSGVLSLLGAAATLITVRSFGWSPLRFTLYVVVGAAVVLGAQRLLRGRA